ncbi:cytochrome P450 [Streptomyces sp. AS58]|uniref:Cytochrome P450 n=1 Tax=Streptomyces cadmiisoli TaxID=2184053 RepID=A0A2Z4IZE3_9ACTN|nr:MULTISPECIES: cytochrome P450 [Streptomyces]AWW37573.1 cytochrome P450 [Streptomyces cadmiisoli]KOV71421.1 cytochrome P450 [Streptomyces sp. AS58]
MPNSEPLPLYGKEYKTDPYPLYRKLREEGPVHRVNFPSGVDAWLVTGYDAAHSALNDDRLGKNHDLGNSAWRERAAIMPEPQHSQLQVHLLHQDPPKHTVMRKMVTEAFSPRHVERMRPRFEEIAAELLATALDGGAETGEIDVVAAFAAHFPFRVLAEVIGLPPALAARFDRDWGKVVQPVGPADPLRPVYEGRLRGLQGYIAEVTEDKRRDPGDDLLTKLVVARDAGEISKEEQDSIVFQLLVAGQEPVTNQITTALVALLRHPAQLRRLQEAVTEGEGHDPALLARAVEELLRYDSAFELTTWRFFAEDAELLGTRVPAGDSVIVSLSAANRDPERFPDADTLDLDRTPNPHLAFGHGIHFCPGAALARIELQIALRALLTGLPGLRLAVEDQELDWVRAVLARGVDELPVSYGPSATAPATGCPVRH